MCRLEVEFMEAVRRRDLPKLERMLGHNFVLTTGRPGSEVRPILQKTIARTFS